MLGDEVYNLQIPARLSPTLSKGGGKKQPMAISERFIAATSVKCVEFRAKIVELATFVLYSIAKTLWSLDFLAINEIKNCKFIWVDPN